MLGILALNEDFSGILTMATASHFTLGAVRSLWETVSCVALSSYRIYEGHFDSSPRHTGFRTQLPSELFLICEL